jgi:hypothetical protein
MTIGIGLLCDGGKRILLAADMRASYGASTSNDQTAKLFDLPSKYCGATSGTISQCEDVISELYHQMSQAQKTPDAEISPSQVRKCITDSYFQIYTELATEALRNDPKITIDQYHHDRTLVTSVRKTAVQALKSLIVDVDLIVAGFCNGQPVQFVATGGEKVTVRAEISPGNAVIGTGWAAAQSWLNYRKQNLTLGLAHSLLHLTEAKQFSEIDHQVGPWRQIILLWPGDFKGLEGGDALIQDWWNRYGLPLSDPLEQEQYNQSMLDTFGLNDIKTSSSEP